MIRNLLQKYYLKIFKRKYYIRYSKDLSTYLQLIPVGSLCFDVGANRGDKTKALLASGMKVISFEPQPNCLRHLEKHCKDYAANLLTEGKALGSKTGKTWLYLTDHIGEASLDPNWGKAKQINSIKVQINTLDAMIGKYGMPYYCKIDVEGHEYEVFKGLSKPFKLCSFEYHIDKENLATVYQCLEYLQSLSIIECNITGAENNALHLRKWKPVNEFMDIFPSEFEGKYDFRYGDIFIRSLDD